MSQKVLITGSSSGFGRLTAETLLRAGHTVIASMRDPESRNKNRAEALRSMGAHIVGIDVTEDTSVTTGVAEALQSAGGIDVLINNAGMGTIGLQEAFTVDDWKALFDLNVFGVQRMNRAVLPHFRQKSTGLLIHISSLLGRFVMPFFGPYNASKHALEALADNYRVELSSLGIESVLVEPGGYGTDFSSSLLAASDSDRTATYGELAGGPARQMEAFRQAFEGDNAPDPQMVADAVLKVIETPRGKRPFRTVVDGLGMGQPIEQINNASEQATSGIYKAFGMEGMLKLK
ncbi:MAG: SDR family oxidoreductase [candidate division Zixibacteria bacterium]|nr:SDR family oxidoreductase [candidate division Zixibacteria bacterium]